MPDARRYRQLYAVLLRLYPKHFRDRFATSMEQTFHDLCRERRSRRVRLFAFALGLYTETFVGILRERWISLMPVQKIFLRTALVTTAILLIPFLAMRFTDELNWTLADFVFGGALLFGTGMTFQLIACRSSHAPYRGATGLAVGGSLLLIWMNLAVGLIGSEDNPANLLYLAVLAVGLVGAGAIEPGAA